MHKENIKIVSFIQKKKVDKKHKFLNIKLLTQLVPAETSIILGVNIQIIFKALYSNPKLFILNLFQKV